MPRIAVPLFLFGLLVSGLMIYFNGWIVPQTNREKFAIERKHLGKNLIGGSQNLHLRLSPSLNMTIDYFDANSGIASRVALERFDTAAPMTFARFSGRSGSTLAAKTDTTTGIKVTERIDATSMRYDSTKHVWILVDGLARNLQDPLTVTVTRFAERELPGITMTPKELDQSQQNIKEMTIPELRSRIERERLGGRDVNRILVDYFAKFSFPFSAFIVVFFGIPFSSAQRKGGAAIPIAVTALVSAIYLVLSEASKAFSYGESFPPVLTAWMANIVFLLIGLFNLFRVERG